MRRVKRVQEYELHGVAFVEGYEKSVGFAFECPSRGKCELTMEDLYQANEVYKLFRKLFDDYSKERLGLQKSLSALVAEWNIAEGQMRGILDRIEKAMGTDWKEAFKTIIYVHKNKP